MSSLEPIEGRCGARVDDGYCERRSPLGAKYWAMIRCEQHRTVKMPKSRQRGEIVHELRRWGLTEQTELADPGETFLKLITQSVARVDFLSGQLREMYDAAARLQAERDKAIIAKVREGMSWGAAQVLVTDPHTPEAERARQDLERIFNEGPIAALVGHRYSATRDGHLYATGEAVRAVAELEGQERDRLGRWLGQAIAAELWSRQIDTQGQLADAQAATVVDVIFDVLGRFGLDPDSQGVREAVAGRLRAVEPPNGEHPETKS